MWPGGTGRDCNRWIQVSFAEEYLQKRPVRKEELYEYIVEDFPQGIIIEGFTVSPQRFYAMLIYLKNNLRETLE